MSELQLNTRVYWLGSKRSWFSISAYHIGTYLAQVYMYRWLFHTPRFTLRLHHIMRSDLDRELHDHPFDFWTFRLGPYTEVLAAKEDEDCDQDGLVYHYRRRFSLQFVKAEIPHRLILKRPVWTLVLSYPKRRAWGYYLNNDIRPESWVRAHSSSRDTP